MTDEVDEVREQLTNAEIHFLKEQIADQKALKRTAGRLQKYGLWLAAGIGGYVLLGEQLPDLIKKWLS